MNRSVTTIVASLAVAIFAASVASGQNAGLRVDEAVVDVGTVVAGDVATARFVLFNDGDRDVRIVRAAPS